MKKIILLTVAFAPILAFAASLNDFIDASYGLVNKLLLPIAFSLCLLYFFWGVTMYIKSGAEGDKGNEGKNVMTRGVIGLFVAFSIWGIITLIRNELGLPDIQNINKQTLALPVFKNV